MGQEGTCRSLETDPILQVAPSKENSDDFKEGFADAVGPLLPDVPSRGVFPAQPRAWGSQEG